MNKEYRDFAKKREAKKRAIARAERAGIKVVTRDAAMAAGLVRYFDGQLCPKRHLSERYVAKGNCIACGTAETMAWREENREAHTANQIEYRRKRCQADPEFAMRVRTRAAVANAIARMGYRKGSKTEQVLGCSWGEFRSHVERQFLPGMTWENWGEWELDHIVAISSAASEEDVLALSKATNLRPLWRPANRKKSNRQEFLL